MKGAPGEKILTLENKVPEWSNSSVSIKLILLALLAAGAQKVNSQTNLWDIHTIDALQDSLISEMGPAGQTFTWTHNGNLTVVSLYESMGSVENLQITITHWNNYPGSCPIEVIRSNPSGSDPCVVADAGIYDDDWIEFKRLVATSPGCDATTGWDIVYAEDNTYQPPIFDDHKCVEAAPLPVELSRFEVMWGKELRAERETASERNVSTFSVEALVGGKFVTLKSEQAVGNSQTNQTYSMTISRAEYMAATGENPGAETLYIRLVSEDLDGSVQYSDVVTTAFEGEGGLPGIQIFWNPVRQSTGIRYALPESFLDDGPVEFRLYNTSGQLVKSYTQDNNMGTLPLQGNRLSQGTYILRATNWKKTLQERVVILG